MSAPLSQTFSHFPHLPPPVNVRLTVLGNSPCPYLPGRQSKIRAFAASEIDPGIYHRFMDAGFRRSGKMVYQPICHGCRECRQIRVPVDAFSPSKSQRRAWRRNADLLVAIGPPTPSAEKFALYSRYHTRWHGGERTGQAEWVSFLYDSPVQSLEFTYRDGERLIAVGICDVSAESLSSVYFYFDPDVAARSLGTHSALYEIDWARKLSIPYYQLGYWVRDCAAMTYKASFRPAEVLGMDGQWRAVT